jgi:hypothetical protein
MAAGITRKNFCRSVLGSTALLLIESCGGGGSGDSSPPGAAAGAGAGCGNTIAANHGHILTIALTDLDSATDISYNILGIADHTHSVTLTVAQLRTLKTGASVGTTSSTSFSHQHDIVITCL